MSKRTQAAEAYVRAMRTGEYPAVEAASKVLAKDVKLNGATAVLDGLVLRRPRSLGATA